MKGSIELSQFVSQLKKELISAQEKAAEPSFALKEVELEVAFVVDGSGKAKPKLLVVDAEAETEALQIHRVKLRFMPASLGKKKEKRKNSPASGTEPDYFE
jgi:hypothetical protein